MPLMTAEQARQLSPLHLAFMGDTVCDLLTRSKLMFTPRPVKDMHLSAARVVNARAQARALGSILPLLEDDESDIVRRAKNAHIGHGAPGAATRAEYQDATGFEALMGYLFLTGRMRRAQTLYDLSYIKEQTDA